MKTNNLKPVLTKKEMNFLNSNHYVQLNFLSFDIERKNCIANLSVSKDSESEDEFSHRLELFMSDNMIQWLTTQRQRYDENGVPTRICTGFELYKEKKSIEKDTLIKELSFNSTNFNTDYYKNPFTIAYSNGSWSIRMLTEASKKRIEYINPNTGEISVQYKTRLQKNGKHMFVAPQFYKRIICQ